MWHCAFFILEYVIVLKDYVKTVMLKGNQKSLQLRLTSCYAYGGDPTFAPAIIAPTMISPTTKRESEGSDWGFGLG